MQDTAPLLGNYQYATLENGIQEPTDNNQQSEVRFYKRMVVGLFVVIGTLSVVLVSGATGGLRPFFSLFQTNTLNLEMPEVCKFTGKMASGSMLTSGQCIASNRSSIITGSLVVSKYQGFYRSILDSDGDVKVMTIVETDANKNLVKLPPTANIPGSIFSKTPRRKLSSTRNFVPVLNSVLTVNNKGATLRVLATEQNPDGTIVFNSQTGADRLPSGSCPSPELRMQYDRNLVLYCGNTASQYFNMKDACVKKPGALDDWCSSVN